MKVEDKDYQAIRFNKEQKKLYVINQLKIPFAFEEIELESCEAVINAITTMIVRGAPVIGACAAYGVYFAVRDYKDQPQMFESIINQLINSRPTAVNLITAVNICLKAYHSQNIENIKAKTVLSAACDFLQKELDNCYKIAENGFKIIEEICAKKNGLPVNILTHCNAGWLACGDWGTATAPIYYANRKGIKVHVWVDETRPRNQGARLTAWELFHEDVPFTIIPDNTGGHLMQSGKVDLVITGADRIAKNGDTANKIGTYLKALAAFDNQIPFYVALPSSTIDFDLDFGLNNIPIEQRDDDEIRFVEGLYNNKLISCNIVPSEYKVANYGFDVTPAKLITGIITEKGICKANATSIINLHKDVW